MNSFILLIQILGWVFLLGMATGMIRPVFVLWFMDRCNRLLVLKIYGIPAMVCWIVYWISRL